MILNKVVSLFFRLIKILFIAKDKTIVYHSFPDVSDNSFALFIYITNNQPDYTNIWLIDDISKKEDFYKTISNYTSSTNFTLIKKNSLKGMFVFFKSKYIIHTHGIFNNIPLFYDHTNINLWHGMPLKNIGHLDNNKKVPRSNYVIATSDLFKGIMARAFDMKTNKVLITGQPRNDFIFENKHSLCDLCDLDKNKFKKEILWMPTYRRSVIGDVRNDGKLENMDDFLSNDNLILLNEALLKTQTICFVKLHPMDYMKKDDFESYTNIHFIDDVNFSSKGLTLYSILSSVDLLLTDFSSIYIDFLLTNKPIGFVFSDFDEYFNSRGFVFDNPKEFMPGKIISTVNELINYLDELFINNKDYFKEHRKKVSDIFHEYTFDFSKRVYNELINSNDKKS